MASQLDDLLSQGGRTQWGHGTISGLLADPTSPDTLGYTDPSIGPATGSVGPIEQNLPHRILGAAGDLLSGAGDATSRWAASMKATPDPKTQLFGHALDFLVGQPAQAGGEGFHDWSQGFAPIDFTGSVTNPVVDREKLMNVAQGAGLLAPFVGAVPGAVRDAGADFIRGIPVSRIVNNGSGESAASVEAINRLAQEKEAGITRWSIDADGNATQLHGVDAVDARAPQGGITAIRKPDGTFEPVDRGGKNQRGAESLATRAQSRGLLDQGSSFTEREPGVVDMSGEEESQPLLRGMPESVTLKDGTTVKVQPNADIRADAEQYASENGIDYTPRTEAARENPELGRRTAQAYEDMEHAPNDPKVKKAYKALVNETLAQYQMLKRRGVNVELWHPDMQESPYPKGPRQAIEDLRDNNHLWIFPTERGFGGDAAEAAQYGDHPLNALTSEVDANGRPMYANDVFRAVHDYFGHAKEGNGFRAPGEYNAFLEHSQMYSPEARRAMASETHGQNSWVNYGPHSEGNAGASETATRYAPQKAGLLPDALIQESADQPMFDYSRLTNVPKNDQEAIPRYEPTKRADLARETRLADNEGAYNRLKAWTQQGMTEDGLGWYNTEELRDKFHQELGPEEGEKQYNKFLDLVGATSAGAKTPINVKIASWYFTRDAQGLPVIKPAKGSGYGHKAQNAHYSAASNVLSGEGMDPFDNPKRMTFPSNLKGNWDQVTVDKHNVRALGMASQDPEWLNTKLAEPTDAKGNPVGAPEWWNAKKYGKWDPENFNPQAFQLKHGVDWEKLPPTWFEEAPSKTNYAALENITKRIAKDLNITPAQAQAAMWLGAGKTTGLGSPPIAFMKVLDQRIGLTAAKRGQTKAEVLKDLIRGKQPLLQLGGATAAGGLLSQFGNDNGGT